MRLVFLGTPRAAVPSLSALVARGHEVALVITRPDRPKGRSSTPAPPPVKVAAASAGLPVEQPAGVRRPAFAERLAALEPDALIVVAFGRILPAAVLEVAPRGAINLHFSLLPAHRGAAPVAWALARGDTVTGVSTMQVTEGLDEGPVFLRREVPIEPGEHAPALESRLSRIGAELLCDTLDGLATGTLTPSPQDPALATHAPPLTRADGEVDPGLTAAEIEGRVRGFDPWPGVWLARDGRRVRLVEARAVERAGPEDLPGTIVALEGADLILACGGGTTLAVSTLQPEGRRALAARDAINGRLLAPGDRLARVTD